MKQKQTTPAEETEDKRPNETPDEESSDGESSDGEASDGLKEAGESMLSHLMALRKVLLISAAAVLIGFVLVFYLAIDPLMAQILAPIQARGIQVIFTTMSEALVTKFKVALLADYRQSRCHLGDLGVHQTRAVPAGEAEVPPAVRAGAAAVSDGRCVLLFRRVFSGGGFLPRCGRFAGDADAVH
jgi:hypothetical protein